MWAAQPGSADVLKVMGEAHAGNFETSNNMLLFAL
jgi:hypothetical protein